jgi:hypothetical protein
MSQDEVVRRQLLELLRGGSAHMKFEEAIEDFPVEAINARAPNVSYSPWALLEHMRIAQWDILEFVRDPDHASPPWPAGYWPAEGKESDAAQWQETIEAFRADMRELEAIVREPSTDLYAELAHAEGYTALREILLVADHNAYHIGEFAVLREVMGTWGR